MTQPGLFDGTTAFRDRRASTVTFRGKMSRPIHRWYRLTPSFSPELADDIADHFDLGPADLVLDPFSGVGTVPLCMKYRGVPACSVELNPFLHFVGTVKTRTYRDPDSLTAGIDSFLAAARSALADLRSDERARDYLAANAAFVPAISNPDRWWSPGNLAQLVGLRRLLPAFADSPAYDLLRTGVLGILIPVSNAKHNHVSLTFADRPLPTTDVGAVLAEKYRDMLADLRAVSARPCAEVTIRRGNSKNLTDVLPKTCRPTAVITSPPYPNRFSYARETRPHLFFFDFVPDARAVGELETEAVGGTWGRATSVLAEGVDPVNDFVRDLLAPYTGGIRQGGPLMAAYVTKYFNDLFAHAAGVAAVCRPAARLAYVVGNSLFYGHPLPTDELLGRTFAHFGFETESIERMRRRQSKSGLYEAVVFLRRR